MSSLLKESILPMHMGWFVISGFVDIKHCVLELLVEGAGMPRPCSQHILQKTSSLSGFKYLASGPNERATGYLVLTLSQETSLKSATSLHPTSKQPCERMLPPRNHVWISSLFICKSRNLTSVICFYKSIRHLCRYYTYNIGTWETNVPCWKHVS